jgi:hypothetical protein
MRLLSLSGVITLALTAACGTDAKKNEQPVAPAPEPTATAAPTAAGEADKAALEAEYAAIPKATIVRVALDAEGRPVGEPEMKTTSSTEGLDSEDGAAAAFEAGDAPQKLADSTDELDDDSSTQSWLSWKVSVGSYHAANTCYAGSTAYECKAPGYESSYAPKADDYAPAPSYQPSYQPYQPSYQPGYTPSCASYASSCGKSHSFWLGYQPWLKWKGRAWNYGYERPSYSNKGGYGYYTYQAHKYW